MELSNIHKIVVNKYTIVYLLSYREFEINSFLKELTKNEQDKLEKIKHMDRKREYVATRVLRSHIFGQNEIRYTAIGAPYIENEKHISISHTLQMVGIAVSEYKIGFDLEPIRDKAKKLSSKFLHSDEIISLNTEDDLEMTTAWSIKETLYKLAGRKEIIFKTDLRICKEKDGWIGTIYNPHETILCKIQTFHSGNNVLTINCEPIEIK